MQLPNVVLERSDLPRFAGIDSLELVNREMYWEFLRDEDTLAAPAGLRRIPDALREAVLSD
jgi:hypothetical protein